jgi:hypothetical protein
MNSASLRALVERSLDPEAIRTFAASRGEGGREVAIHSAFVAFALAVSPAEALRHRARLQALVFPERRSFEGERWLDVAVDRVLAGCLRRTLVPLAPSPPRAIVGAGASFPDWRLLATSMVGESVGAAPLWLSEGWSLGRSCLVSYALSPSARSTVAQGEPASWGDDGIIVDEDTIDVARLAEWQAAGVSYLVRLGPVSARLARASVLGAGTPLFEGDARFLASKAPGAAASDRKSMLDEDGTLALRHGSFACRLVGFPAAADGYEGFLTNVRRDTHDASFLAALGHATELARRGLVGPSWTEIAGLPDEPRASLVQASLLGTALARAIVAADERDDPASDDPATDVPRARVLRRVLSSMSGAVARLLLLPDVDPAEWSRLAIVFRELRWKPKRTVR